MGKILTSMKIFVASSTDIRYVFLHSTYSIEKWCILPFLMAAYVILARIALKGRQRP